MINKKKINILLVESGLGFGGAITCLKNLVSNLDNSKYRFVVATTHCDPQTIKIFKDIGVKYYILKSFKRFRIVYVLFEQIYTMSKFLRYVLVSLITLFELFINVPFMFSLALLIKKEDINIIHFNNQIKPDEIIVSRLIGIPCIVHQRTYQYNSIITRFIARFVSQFIAISTYTEESLRSLGIDTSKIHVVYDGIKIDSFDLKDKTTALSADYNFRHINIGLFGILLPWKGQETLLRAAEILINRKEKLNISFFIVGDYPGKNTNYKNYLLTWSHTHGLAPYVIFTGHKEENEVRTLMSKMDLIVHTSILPEPFGMVIIEGMAAQKPVVASNVGGPLDIIDDGINGLLIPPDDPELLAHCIMKLLDDPDRMKSLSMRARDKVACKFSMDNYKKISEVYDKIMPDSIKEYLTN